MYPFYRFAPDLGSALRCAARWQAQKRKTQPTYLSSAARVPIENIWYSCMYYLILLSLSLFQRPTQFSPLQNVNRSANPLPLLDPFSSPSSSSSSSARTEENASGEELTPSSSGRFSPTPIRCVRPDSYSLVGIEALRNVRSRSVKVGVKLVVKGGLLCVGFFFFIIAGFVGE